MDKQLYLLSSEVVNWQHPLIQAKANELANGLQSEMAISKVCFEFVRDEIKHSSDFQMNPVTYKASDVLQFATGYCYAKSHLLAALLRANGIATGFCYQRLTITGDKPPFCLHGLNAVYLADFGWYRMDARGDRAGVSAKFTPPVEGLPFPIVIDGEADLPEIWSEPLTIVLDVLREHETYQQVLDNLPDIELTKPR